MFNMEWIQEPENDDLTKGLCIVRICSNKSVCKTNGCIILID